ncbi:unnamed protein product [Oppiella nova]|uniref:Ig-like domain-containing protein n=1 Tax=Oppiella nova TaxID=334625 RepID=A0A7R9QP98_9ACAR|nr:unnamed protein product [Oppiella nova]CAG2169321.1 unnamed protein product [Oppiella nova]
MQPCPSDVDFRGTQCSQYNNKPYRERRYEWLPYLDPLDSCSLTCRSKVFNFVAKLSPKVEDGTRCRAGSLDMCVSGKCLSVGCDLVLGSDNKVDGCGICGGDGTSCSHPTYIWSETNYSPCSVSCGRGYQMSQPICMNKEANEEVDEILCDPTSRPRPHINECNVQKCPPFWIIESWCACSRRCGGGKQTRDVYCVQDVVNGTRLKVSDSECLKQKPITEKSCNIQECPQCVLPLVSQHFKSELWFVETFADFIDSNENSQEDSPGAPHHSQRLHRVTNPSISTEPNYIVGEWSTCSTSCGNGIKKRSVDCKIFLEFSRSVVRLPDSQCSGVKPKEIESCFLKDCQVIQEDDEDMDDADEDEDDDSDNHIISTGIEKPTNKLIPLSKIGIETKFFWKSSGFTECSATCLGGTQESIILCVRDTDQSTVNPYLCDINKKPDSFTRTCNDHPCPPRWNVSEYGIKDCQVIQEDDEDMDDADEDEDDDSDNHIISTGIEKPTNKLIPLSKIGIETKFFWKSSGFTECSATCLGGTQESIILCVRDTDQSTVNPYLCDINKKPDSFTRTCNDHPCPPRWNVSEYGICSKECGGGVQIREVHCVHEVTRGTANTIVVANHLCKEAMPKTKQFCNVVDCQPKWEAQHWTQCSRSCGGGVKTRKLKCIKELAFGQIVEQSVAKCPKKRPKAIKTLNGEAIVMSGTILRLRCPRHKSNKDLNHIQWLKNNANIMFGHKIKMTAKNVLRIKSADISDSGVYSCSWDNKTIHKIDLKIKHMSTSDEDRTVERHNFGPNNYDLNIVAL